MRVLRHLGLAVACCGALLPSLVHADNGIAGDANCDSEVTVLDAQAILQYTAERIDSLPCPANADVNHNGHVGAVDAALILQLDAGLLSAL